MSNPYTDHKYRNTDPEFDCPYCKTSRKLSEVTLRHLDTNTGIATIRCNKCQLDLKLAEPPRELLYDAKGQVGGRDDRGKVRINLVPPELLIDQAALFTLGANKYNADNWKKGMNYSRCYNSLLRHLWAWWMGEEIDGDNGQHHLTSVIWNAMALRFYTMYPAAYIAFDDRPLPPVDDPTPRKRNDKTYDAETTDEPYS